MNKKVISVALSTLMVAGCLTGCGGTKTTITPAAKSESETELTETQKIIKEAEGMSMEELAKKAIAESNGKNFCAVGNSSRGAKALPSFIEYLQTIDSSYTMEFDWQKPNDNGIFEQLSEDALKDKGTFAMTLIQDGNQIQSKMAETGILDTYIPKEWAEANNINASEYSGFLVLQSLNKVFEYNTTGSKTYDNCWDFVGKDVHSLYMDIDKEVVGKNFLYMLTENSYATCIKDAYDALSDDEKAYFQPTIDAEEQDAKDFSLGENGKYALAWIKLWVENYDVQEDDAPICETLSDSSAKDKSGLLVYSKLRSIKESETTSVDNIQIAAYQNGYKGIGGFGYCHYLFITDNSPLPWTACAFSAYLTCTQEGFSAWGKDMGGYSGNPDVAAATEAKYLHKTGGNDEDGTVLHDCLNDRGYDWWTTKGNLVMEDPEYCASVYKVVGKWLDSLSRYNN